MRAKMSVPPPVPNGTTMRTGFSGYFWAAARSAANAQPSATMSAPVNAREGGMNRVILLISLSGTVRFAGPLPLFGRERYASGEPPSLSDSRKGKNRMSISLPSAIASLLAAAALLHAPQVQAAAGEYPTRTVRMIVPFAPGGSNDIMARLVGQHFSESFGQPVVMDNRPGASGIIGTDVVAQAQLPTATRSS
jgi:hypothetical protein